MMIPQLTFSLKVTEVILMYDFKIFISIEIVIIPMINSSQLQLDEGQAQLIEGFRSIENHTQMMLGSGLFELPVCARCFLGYSCKNHVNH